MEVVLGGACRDHGGDQKVRKYAAEQLLMPTEERHYTRADLWPGICKDQTANKPCGNVHSWPVPLFGNDNPIRDFALMASVLIVEDEPLIRMMLADMLAELGHTIAGEANDLASGLMLAFAPGLDAAILDVNLGADSSEAIARALEGRGIPFAFASGYGADGLPQEFRSHPALGKPFQVEELERCLVTLLG